MNKKKISLAERLKNRAVKKLNSCLWTYKAYFKAGDCFSRVSTGSDWVIAAITGIIAIELLWENISNMWLVVLAIISAIIASYKGASKPQARAEQYYKAANQYHELFNDFEDFIQLELPKDNVNVQKKEKLFLELSDRYKKLNRESIKISSFWHNRLNRESIYQEVSSTEDEERRLLGVEKD